MFDEDDEDEDDEIEEEGVLPINPVVTPDLLVALGINVADVKEAVIQRLVQQTLNLLQKDVKEATAKQVDQIIEIQVSQWVKGFLEKPYQPINNWSQPKGDVTTIQKVLEERSISFMTELVDDKGKIPDYRSNGAQPRFMWAAKQVAGEALEKELRPHLIEVVNAMKTAVQQGIQKMIADLVSRNFK